MPSRNERPSFENNWRNDIAEIVMESHEHLLGSPILVDDNKFSSRSEALFNLRYAVLVHDTQPDPIFCYGNLAALKIFEYEWEGLLRVPSRKSAEQTEQSNRAKTMQKVQKTGYAESYSGVRVSSSGRRLLIQNTTIWNLIDTTQKPLGQAALIKEYRYL